MMRGGECHDMSDTVTEWLCGFSDKQTNTHCGRWCFGYTTLVTDRYGNWVLGKGKLDPKPTLFGKSMKK